MCEPSEGQVLVSCVLPTRDRPDFVTQAVWYFLRQDHPSRELIVVDDGNTPVEARIPSDPRVRYLRFSTPSTLGAKLNAGCRAARGVYIAHWEDDDWMAPDRLTRQVAHLVEGGCRGCLADRPLHYHLTTGQVWRWSGSSSDCPAPRCGSAFYLRAAWEAVPFPEQDRWTGQPFPPALRDTDVLRDTAVDYYIKLIHPDNSGAHGFTSRGWERRPLADAAARLSYDETFYAHLRGGARPSAPVVPDRVTFASPAIIYDGYGSLAQYLALGLVRAGANVDVVPFSLDRSGFSPDFLRLIDDAVPAPDAPTLVSTWPREDLSRLPRTRDLFFHSMWESSRLPTGWGDAFARCRMVFVPTTFVQQVFADSGVSAPIAVVPLGVDPGTYRLVVRPERSGFRTLIVGTFIPRRNIEIGIAAWKLAFGSDPEARLIIKSRFRCGVWTEHDPRITFVDSEEPTVGIAHYYHEADALLALGNEGFGLPLVEGMATGLPVVALDSEGQADVCAEAREFLLPVPPARWVSDGTTFPDSGVRAVPEAAEVAKRLRWIATHPEEARTMGQAASAWVLRHRVVWDTAPRMLEHMERSLIAPRPLRRRHTFIVPSWNTPCGLAEYTVELTRHLDGVQATAALPDLCGVSSLHVQHEFSLFTDAEAASTLRRARVQGIPTTVTLHTVTPQARAWEHDADMLITLTQRGEQWLRERNPGKRVVWVPHGCPEYFPPRKKTRGRTIGAFGFLHRHKGFWSLLELLRTLPGTDLVLYSYGRSEAEERAWEQDSAGLPVRRERAYLPAEEVASRLAAEADILVFWYSDVAHAASSGAARVALATGVPVLTSRCTMFDGLDGVTYRPDDLRAGVETLLDDCVLRNRLSADARDFCTENSWKRVASTHAALWKQL